MQQEERRSLGEIHPFAEAWRASAPSDDEAGRAIGMVPLNLRLISAFRLASLAATGVLLLVGSLAFADKLLDFLHVRYLLPDFALMHAHTALSFILAGVSLLLLRKESADPLARGVAQASALLVVVMGLLAVADKLLGWDLGVDQLLFRRAEAASTSHVPGRMAFASGLNFVLTGCALLLLDVETRRGHRPGQWLAFLAVPLSLLGILDYTLYPPISDTGMSLATAVLFAVLCTGILLARPDRGAMSTLVSDGYGGVMARRLLPAGVGISMLLAWLRLVGERAGLYGTPTGLALYATSNAVVLALLVGWNARGLDRADGERRQSEHSLGRAHEELEARVATRTADLEKVSETLKSEAAARKRAEEAASYLAAIVQSSDDAIIGDSLEGVIVSWNAAAERIYGYTAGEVIGRPMAMLVRPDRQEEVPRMLERLRRGERIEHFDTLHTSKSGETLHISLTISPVKDPEGKIIGASAIARDVTEAKRSGEALQQANAVLTGWLRELEKRTHETTLLNDMGDLLQTCVTAEEAYAVIARYAQQLFPTESGALCVLNASQNLVEAVAVWGKSPTGERVFAPEECWALRRGQVHLLEDAASGLVCRHVGRSPGVSYLCVPMMGQGEALGVLHLQGGSPSSEMELRLTETKQRLAVTAAGHIALALANLRLRETLRMQSIRDPLTGLFNRRYMEESLARELRRSARNQRTLGAIMMDLDHFKRFNDTFGHEAGDALLRELGEFLRTRTRREDIACRYGGEEFVVILPEASIEATRQRAERLREEFKHLNIQHRGRSLGTVTLSLGVAVFPEHASTVEDILRCADRALYRAKAEGRDRVVLGEAVG